jgi:hypothetical protein
MNSTRVVVLSNQSILTFMVQQALAERADIELIVIKINSSNWAPALVEAAPDTIVMDSDCDDEVHDITLRLLRTLSGVNLITLDLDHPFINLFNMVRVPRSDLEGLVAAIHRTA